MLDAKKLVDLLAGLFDNDEIIVLRKPNSRVYQAGCCQHSYSGYSDPVTNCCHVGYASYNAT